MSDERVTITSYEFVALAEVAQLFLRENGIVATLRDDGIVAMDWLLGNAVGYVKLQVPREQVAAAEELLSSLPKRAGVDACSTEATSLVCPSCGLALGNELDQCPACGAETSEASGNRSNDKVPPIQSSTEEAEDEESPRGVIGRIGSLKKPVFLLLMLPLVFLFWGLANALVQLVLENLRS